jgi:hypothetical protein
MISHILSSRFPKRNLPKEVLYHENKPKGNDT